MSGQGGRYSRGSSWDDRNNGGRERSGARFGGGGSSYYGRDGGGGNYYGRDNHGGGGHYGPPERDASRYENGNRNGSYYGRNEGGSNHSRDHAESRYGDRDGGRNNEGVGSYYGHSQNDRGGSGYHGNGCGGRYRDRDEGPYGHLQGGYGGGGGNRRSGYGGGGDRGGRGRGGRGSEGRAPDLSGITEVSTNIIPASVTPLFSFFQYTLECVDKDGNPIDSRFRRAALFREGFWNNIMKDLPAARRADWNQMVDFQGSFFFSTRAVPELENKKFPLDLATNSDGDTIRCVRCMHFTVPEILTEGLIVNDGDVDLGNARGDSNGGKRKVEEEGDLAPAQWKQARRDDGYRDIADDCAGNEEVTIDSFRCADCTASFADTNALLQHCRSTGHSPVLQQSLAHATPASPELFIQFLSVYLEKAMRVQYPRWGRHFVDDKNGEPMRGCIVFPAYVAEFGLQRINSTPTLVLTLDRKAKVIRDLSLLDEFNPRGEKRWTREEMVNMDQQVVGQVVIYKREHKCYTVARLDFDNSPDTLEVSGTGMNHTEYFRSKGVQLEYPRATPMVVVLGRRDQMISLPLELVMKNELDAKVRESLPQIASSKPDVRKKAIDAVASLLTRPGALLSSVGILLSHQRLRTAAIVIPSPQIFIENRGFVSAGANFGGTVTKANFNVNPSEVTTLRVVLVRHSDLRNTALNIFQSIRSMVNNFNSRFCLEEQPYDIIDAGRTDNFHQEAVHRRFSGPLPDNVFVLDFVRPSGKLDSAYPTIKHILGKGGHLSQFVNFTKCSHVNGDRKSGPILQGVARQILQKCGVIFWYARIPPELPLPAMFVGIDVFHAPMTFDRQTERRDRNASCAAIVIVIIEKDTGPRELRMFTRTYKRAGGEENKLEEPLKETISRSMQVLNVQPRSAVVWRDGIGDSAFENHANAEVQGVREGLGTTGLDIPLAYIVCQKEVATKFFVEQGNATYGAPPGTVVSDVSNLDYPTFYITATSPPFSTPKPTRFTIIQQDDILGSVNLTTLSCHQCYDYPNWTGPIKVPATLQMADKLAALCGQFPDCGESLDAQKYAGKPFFL